MSRWEHRYLGQERFPDALSTMEIEHFFSLSEDELAAVRRRRTVLNRLALALQIGFLKMTGGRLNSVEIIPTGVLEHLGLQLGCAPPRIASIRALYRRRRTLFDHQAAALHTLGRTEPSEHAERGLVAYLRREAAAAFDNVELMTRSRSWLVDHDYLVLREREIRRLIGAARRHQEQALFKIIAAVAGPDREAWLPRLLAPIEDGGISHLEWLGAVPSGKGPTSLEAQIEKVGFLKQLGAERLGLRDLPLAGLTHFARRMMSRKAAALARIKDPHRTIEIACFLRLRLLQLTDASLTLLDHQIAAQWRGGDMLGLFTEVHPEIRQAVSPPGRRDPGGGARICRGGAPGSLPCGRAHLFAVEGGYSDHLSEADPANGAASMRSSFLTPRWRRQSR